MVLRVQHRVRDPAALEQRRDVLALLYGYGADKHGLPFLVAAHYLFDYRAVFPGLVFIYDVGVVYTYDGLVRGYLDNVELIDGLEFLCLGRGGAGHTGELAVETEVVLESDGRKSFVLLLHINMLLGLYRLMQTLGIAPPEHEPP